MVSGSERSRQSLRQSVQKRRGLLLGKVTAGKFIAGKAVDRSKGHLVGVEQRRGRGRRGKAESCGKGLEEEKQARVGEEELVGEFEDENNEAKAATSDDDVVDEKVVNNKKNFGRKNQNSKKRSTKRSGEFEGLDGGTKSNIFSTTTTTSRLHNSEEVDKKNGGDFSTKSKNVVVVKNSSEDAKRDSNEKGILNRAIGRLLQQRHRREVDDDADVEDEVDDKLSVVANGD